MTGSKNNDAKGDYVRTTLCAEQFCHTGTVHIHGNACVAGSLVVDGDLIVNGRLEAKRIFCTGNLTVGVDLQGDDVAVGSAVHAGGQIRVARLQAGFGFFAVVSMIHPMESLVPTDMADHLRLKMRLPIETPFAFRRKGQAYTVIQAAEDVICTSMVSRGGVQVGGTLLASRAQIDGDLHADHIRIAEQLAVSASIHCDGEVQGDGTISSGRGMRCGGSLDCGSMLVDDGDIHVSGHVRTTGDLVAQHGTIDVGEWIVSAGTVTSGRDIRAGQFIIADKGLSGGQKGNIAAGFSLPPSCLSAYGYVCAPKRPANMVRGEFRARKPRTHGTAAPDAC